jgi:hypothetical protein
MKNQVIELLKSVQNEVMNIEKPNKFGYQISFTQEDVSKLLGSLIVDVSEIEEKSTTNVDLDKLRDELDTEILHIISYFDYDENISLDISGREVEVSFDEDDLERDVKRKIEDIFENLQEEMENEENENVVSE